MSLLDYLGWNSLPEHFTGALTDPRSYEKRALDHAHEERVLGYGLSSENFRNEKILTSPYFQFNQQGVGSCGSHAVGTALMAERRADGNPAPPIAPLFNYRLRGNYPEPGTWLQNVFANYVEYGAPLYASLPTPTGATEATATRTVLTDALKTEAQINKGKSYWRISHCNNIDTLASVAQAGHAVPIFIYGTYAEWARRYPVVNDYVTVDNAPIKHFVCILPRSGFIENGTKYVAVQDSAWFGGLNIRYVSQEFIATRVTEAMYWDETKPLGSGPVPNHVFTTPIKYGQQSSEVVAMQKLFIALGLLPNDCASGYFGGRTLAALRVYQTMYSDDILVPSKLTAPTSVFGYLSIKKANALCQAKNS